MDATAITGSMPKTVDIAWSGSAWATAYRVRRSTTTGGPYAGVSKVTGLTLTDSGRTSGRQYFYVITALNDSGESGPSIEVGAVAR
jgi:hypothetical protein